MPLCGSKACSFSWPIHFPADKEAALQIADSRTATVSSLVDELACTYIEWLKNPARKRYMICHFFISAKVQKIAERGCH
jgi:hypothetical protein